jgi:hypothetical protein
MIKMNVYDGKTGEFLYSKPLDEKKASTELKNGNAVEVYNSETNKPISKAVSYLLKTDQDGFASLRKSNITERI